MSGEVRWCVRVYEDGKFVRWSVGGPHPAEELRDGSLRSAWDTAEDAWADIRSWRKKVRIDSLAPRKPVYRLVKLTRKPKTTYRLDSEYQAMKKSYEIEQVAHDIACRDLRAEVARLREALKSEDVVQVGSRLWRCEKELDKARAEVQQLKSAHECREAYVAEARREERAKVLAEVELKVDTYWRNPPHGSPWETLRHWLSAQGGNTVFQPKPEAKPERNSVGWDKYIPGTWFASCVNDKCKMLHKGLMAAEYRCSTCGTVYSKPAAKENR
jgi:hypothetical protein